jgi:hypothetical protein
MSGPSAPSHGLLVQILRLGLSCHKAERRYRQSLDESTIAAWRLSRDALRDALRGFQDWDEVPSAEPILEKLKVLVASTRNVIHGDPFPELEQEIRDLLHQLGATESKPPDQRTTTDTTRTSHNAEMRQYLYLVISEEKSKPRRDRLRDAEILEQAKRDHPEWHIDFTARRMVQIANEYQEDYSLTPIPKTAYKRRRRKSKN